MVIYNTDALIEDIRERYEKLGCPPYRKVGEEAQLHHEIVRKVILGLSPTRKTSTLIRIANALGATYEPENTPNVRPRPPGWAQTAHLQVQLLEMRIKEMEERLDALETHVGQDLFGHTHD